MDFFDDCVVTFFKNAHFHESKHIILQKLLQKCADTVMVRLIWHADKKLFIHPDNMVKIDLKWNDFIEANIRLLPEEINLYKLVKSELFVNLTDVQKFINIFINKNEVGFLTEILAIDGFSTQNPLKYVENLKIGDNGSSHIQIIRKIYKELKSVHVEIVYLSLLKIYLHFAKDDEIIQLLLNTINSIKATESNIVTSIYINNIDNLETTALTKIAHLKLFTKKINRPVFLRKKKDAVI